MAAGLRLLSERPIDAVTVDEIVQAAEVGKGSFYNHFTDREALARAITAQIRASIESAIARVNAGVEDPARRLARAVCTYLRHALDEPEQAGVLVHIHSGHTSLSAPLNRGLVEDLETGLATGRFEVATVESGVLYVLGVTQLALVRIVQEPSPAARDLRLAQQMCGLVLRGSASQPPRRTRSPPRPATLSCVGTLGDRRPRTEPPSARTTGSVPV